MESQYTLRGKEKTTPRMQQHKGEKGSNQSGLMNLVLLPSSCQMFQEYQPTSTLLTNQFRKESAHSKIKKSTLKLF